ncbi:TPM domain-containing protein [Microbacterium sp. A82]|uniref:TPM domain-containing protein n=1 Tax=Microbacterium sp. A82 TaxID=3450452 RepID=UPI003F332F71
MKTRWRTTAVITSAMLLGALTAPAAHATDPLPLDPGYVTDSAGVLSAGEKQATEERLQELTENSTADLFVVLVDEFTSPSDHVVWADNVADRNNLGPEQYLLAVAVEGRAFYISAAQGGPLSEGKLSNIEDAIQPLLAAKDWDGAIILAADEIQGDGGAGMLRGVLIFAGIVALALVAWLVIALIRRARKNAEIRRRGAMPEKPDPNDPFSTMTDEQVETEAGSALVQADDAITSSREELGFAVAQYGEGATAAFSGAIESAQQKMSQAFDLKQKLDDEIEDTIHERRAWHIRIIQLCDEIDDVLDDNTEAFDALRKLEQNAPQELERVRAERAQVEPLVTGASAALAALAAAYAPEALGAISDNPAEARERADLADHSIEAATSALAAGSNGEAAFAIRTAEQAAAQAAQLANAIAALGTELAESERQSTALIIELKSDLAAAQQLPDASGAISAAMTATTTQLQQAEADLAGPARNPQRVLDALTAANAQIDAAIAQGRENVERTRRAQLMLQQTLTQADSQVRGTRDFIQTRRGTVGSTARTRLSQAEASLTHAHTLEHSDPQAALSEAQRALSLARQAQSTAQSDINSYSHSQYDSGFGGGFFGGSSHSSSSGIGGDILGGIIGGLLSGGGGGGRSSSGRSSWRSSSSSGFRSSGFGGGSRSGGGSRGGGGRSGRSGGGRF